MNKEQLRQEFEKKVPRVCPVCMKSGVNTLGECLCSYKSSPLCSREQVLSFFASRFPKMVEELIGEEQIEFQEGSWEYDARVVARNALRQDIKQKLAEWEDNK